MMSPPPGSLFDIGTHRLHIRCLGEGHPTVVFDSALGGSSLSWTLVQPAVARTTHACAYDRAGFGWSGAGPMPRTAGRCADELRELLRRADVRAPYVLVGHSFGGLVMRMFASRWRDDTAALVLIEPAIPEEWAEPSEEHRRLIARGSQLCGYGTIAARLRLAHVVSWLVRLGALTPARALVKMVSRGGLRREDEGILAPIWKLPPDIRALLRQMWTQPSFFEALGSQIASICVSAAEVLATRPGDLRDLPLTVMTSAAASEHRLQADRALSQRSARGQHIVISDCGHWIPLDNPKAVIDAVNALSSTSVGKRQFAASLARRVRRLLRRAAPHLLLLFRLWLILILVPAVLLLLGDSILLAHGCLQPCCGVDAYLHPV
jgi:pimeloyl-ACP methyl ester carboxylesterase